MTREPSPAEIHAVVHYEDGVLTWKNRNISKVDKQFAGKTAGSLRPDGYIALAWKGKQIMAHRLIWIMHNGSIPNGLFIDHINRDRKDNRLKNLRLCSISENNCNAKLRIDNSSKVKGVCWDNQRSKWKARVSYKGRQFHAGFHVELQDAADAVRIKREQIHNEFAAHHDLLMEAGH
jgi:hypothetical protein